MSQSFEIEDWIQSRPTASSAIPRSHGGSAQSIDGFALDPRELEVVASTGATAVCQVNFEARRRVDLEIAAKFQRHSGNDGPSGGIGR